MNQRKKSNYLTKLIIKCIEKERYMGDKLSIQVTKNGKQILITVISFIVKWNKHIKEHIKKSKEYKELWENNSTLCILQHYNVCRNPLGLGVYKGYNKIRYAIIVRVPTILLWL